MSTPSNITLRTDIGRPLVYEELDINFEELKFVIVESNAHIASSAAHEASAIVYSNTNLSASNVEEALDALGVKNNLSGTSDPTVNNDISDGYAAFSRWVNTVTKEYFLCLYSANGAAVWVKSSLTLDELGTAALSNIGTGASQIRTNAENDQVFIESSVIFDALSSSDNGDGASLISMEDGTTVEFAVSSKANQSTTYTKTESDTLLNAKADQATTYTETGVDDLIATRTESPGETAITASATFTNSTNNIALTDIGSIGLEIGDVVQVTGTANNNKLFTVEVITDSGNVIVNQAHAGGTTRKSLVDETVSATVTLLAKWFNASDSLGRGWVSVVGSRSSGVTYTNLSNRGLLISTSDFSSPNGSSIEVLVDGITIARNSTSTGPSQSQGSATVPIGSSYSATSIDGNVNNWAELR
jgi:hypothetical protein